MFGAGIQPVVFSFEDREAREATYARYLGGPGSGRRDEGAVSDDDKETDRIDKVK